MGGFENTDWSLQQVLIWLYTGDREMVSEAAKWEPFGMDVIHKLAMPRLGETKVPTIRSFEDCERELVVELRKGRLVARGVAKNEIVRRKIPEVDWIDLRFSYDPPGAVPPASKQPKGATSWYDLKFPSEMALELWPDQATESAAVEGNDAQKWPIELIAQLWVAVTQNPAITAAHIEDEMVKAVARGEFEFKPEGKWRDKRGRAPKKYDLRMQRLTEVFDDQGLPVMAHEIEANIKVMVGKQGLSRHRARHILARDLSISIEGLRRWYEADAFAPWASPLGLKAPSFILLDKPASEATPEDEDAPEQGAPPKEPPHADMPKSVGRKTDTESRRVEILKEFELLAAAGDVSYGWGGLQKAVRALAPKFDSYAPDSIRKIIQPDYKAQQSAQERKK